MDGTHLGYTYDSLHRLVVMTNAQGQSTTNVYDSSNRVTTQTDALKRVSTFAYASGQTTISPIPMLKARNISSRSMPPRVCSTENIGGIVQL